MPVDITLYGLMLQTLRNAPSQIIVSSSPVRRLLAAGNHMDLEGEIAELHAHLESMG